MGNESYLIFLAVMFWAAGYFFPENVSGVPHNLLRSYIILPKGLNGFLRKRKSNTIPAGVVSTAALGVQLGAHLIILLFIGYQFHLAFLNTLFFRVYGAMVCIFLGMMFSILIGKFRPFISKESQSN